MKSISLVRDKIDGSPFAVLLITNDEVTAFGSSGQGKNWADWVNSQNTQFDSIDDLLDVRLVADTPVPAKKFNESNLSSYLDQENMDLVMNELNKKILLEIIKTKSAEQEEPINYTEEDDLPDFVPMSVWPLSDVSLAAIDVSFKSNLTDYKAKAFNIDRDRRAIELEVKWARAIWDNDRQGWRCPPETPNGGQFTNRMGLGCTTGMVRRLGQTLMSIEDRNKLQMTLPGLEDPRGFLYRAGALIDERAETRVRKFAERKERRAARRVRNIIAKEGKKEQEKLQKEKRRHNRSGESMGDIYRSLTPDASRTSRVRAAGAVKLRRFAARIEEESLRDVGQSQQRRDRRMRAVTEETLSPRKLKQLRDNGGRIPGSDLGGYVQMDVKIDDETYRAMDVNGQLMVPRVLVDMDEMHSNPFYGRPTLKDDTGKEIPNPHVDHKWVTVEEVLAMSSVNRATKPVHDWIEMRKGRGFPGDETISYVDAKELKKIQKENGSIGVRVKLKDDGKGTSAGRGKGKAKTKPAQGGPIGDLEWQPDELQPTTAKQIRDSWRESRRRLGSWIASLDPLSEDDGKTRREKRREKRSKATKSASAVTADGFWSSLYSDIDSPIEAMDRAREASTNSDSFRQWFESGESNNSRRWGFNEVIGTPTPEFAAFKKIVDGVIGEHGGEILVEGRDSANPLRNEIENNFEFKTNYRTSSAFQMHNLRVVTLNDGVEERQVIVLDTVFATPWTDNPRDGNNNQLPPTEAGILQLTTSSKILDVPQDIVEQAAQGDMRVWDFLESANFALMSGRPGTTPGSVWLGFPPMDGTRGLGGSRVIRFNKKGAPLTIATGYHAVNLTPNLFGAKTVHFSGVGNAAIDLRTGAMIAGRMGPETILTPDGEKVLDDPSINPFTGEKEKMWLDRLPGAYRGRKSRRRVVGDRPERPGIISRVATAEGRQFSRERRAARRMIKGKTPKDTRPLRQRIEASLYERSRRRTGDVRPEWLQAPDINQAIIEQEIRDAARSNDPETIASLPQIAGVYEWLLPESYPAGTSWWDSGVNKQRVDALNASLHELGGSFFPPVTQEDLDRLPELAEQGRLWLEDINDPDQQSVPGEVSNWGFAEWKEFEGITYVYDSRNETKPPIAIIHNASGTTHLIGKDGKHLLSLVPRLSSNGENVFVPIGSPELHRKLETPSQETGFLQTLLGKFRRRDRQQVETEQVIPGLRGRRRTFTRGDTSINDVRAIFEAGDAGSSPTWPYSFATQQRTGSQILPKAMSDAQVALVLASAEKMQAQLEADFRRQLGLPRNEALTEDAIKDFIDDLSRDGRKREAGIAINNLHDLAVLDDLLFTQDIGHVNNLKPGRRHMIMLDAGIPLSDAEKKSRRRMTPDLIWITKDTAGSSYFRLSDTGERGQFTSRRTFPQGDVNLLDVATPQGPSSPRPTPTGPALIPGTGDVTGTIIYRGGLYFDTSTGRYVEDLTGLDSDGADFLHKPVPLENYTFNALGDLEGEEFPKIILSSGPGAPRREVAVAAPGINPQDKRVAVQTRPDLVEAIATQPSSFTELFYMLRNRWRALGSAQKSEAKLQKLGRNPVSTSELISGINSPLLARADGLETEEGMSLFTSPINAPGRTINNAAEVLRAIRNASRKSPTENGLFDEYLPGSTGDLRHQSTIASGPRELHHLHVLDSLGIMESLPFETVYLPSTQLIGNQVDMQAYGYGLPHIDNGLFMPLNSALQLDFAAKKMRALLDSGSQQDRDGWDRTWGRRAGGRYDITQADVEEVERMSALAWKHAADELSRVASEYGNRRNDSLGRWRAGHGFGEKDNDKDLAEVTNYVMNGVIAEQAEYLLHRHIITNDDVMQQIAESHIADMTRRSIDANKRIDRLEQLRSAQTAAGRRATGGYSPDDVDPIELLPILDRHGDGVTTTAPLRDLGEISEIMADHKALGFASPLEIDPITGEFVPQILTDDQIEALALIDYAFKRHNIMTNMTGQTRNAAMEEARAEFGYAPGSPEADTAYGHIDVDALDGIYKLGQRPNMGDNILWGFLQASGFNDNPLLLDVQELREIAQTEDGNGKRQAILLSRGIGSSADRSGRHLPGTRFVSMLLRLKRSITGTGGQQHGTGEYWSSQPAEWSSNNEAAAIGVLARDMARVASHEVMIGPSSSARNNGEGGIISSHMYEALWSIANALGARGFGGGTNTSHGREYQTDIPVNSVRFDPATGLYDQGDLDALRDKVMELLEEYNPNVPGSKAGLMTVEDWSLRTGSFQSSIIPDMGQGSIVNQERNDAAQRERRHLNAWLGQQASWLIQLAQLRRDESDPVSGDENKEWNRRLEAAGHSLVMMTPNGRAALMGYDALVRNTQNSIQMGGLTDANNRFSDYDFWEDDVSRITLHPPKVVVLLNRTAIPMLRTPHEPAQGVTNYSRSRASMGWLDNTGLTWDDIVPEPLANPTTPEEIEITNRLIMYLRYWGLSQ
jgi:hypothetical protein